MTTPTDSMGSEITVHDFYDTAFHILNGLVGHRLSRSSAAVTERHVVAGSVVAGGSRDIQLNRPARHVSSVVRVDGDCPITWEAINGYIVRISAESQPIPCTPCSEVEIVYIPQQTSAVVEQAIVRLAEELYASKTGGPCALPERVTSVTRQGVTWTLLDPQDFFDRGLTGIYAVDIVIRAFNPSKALRRARVWTVERPPAKKKVAVPTGVGVVGSAPVDLYFTQGIPKIYRFMYGASTTSPYPLAACTARAQVRAAAGAPVDLEFSTTAGTITLTDGDDGWNVQIELTNAAANALDFRSAEWDFILTYPDLREVKLFSGRVIVDPSVTVTT